MSVAEEKNVTVKGKRNLDTDDNEDSNEVPQNNKTMDLDAILVEELGQLGRFQIQTLLKTLLVVIFAAFHAEYVFTTARIETRCLVPECEGDLPEFAPSWLNNAIPTTGASFDNCHRYSTNTSASIFNVTCPAELFDRNTLVPCDEYVYEHFLTVVYDYGLACDEWRRTLIGTVRAVGMMVSWPLTGYISDRWGRRTTLVLNAFSTACIGILRYWAGTYIGYTISEVVEAICGAGVFSCVYILVLELVGPQYRVVAAAVLHSLYAIGQVIMGFIAWGVPAWRPLTLALYVPQLITIIYLWIIPESVRWYMSKGRYQESETVLREVARVNGKQLSENFLKDLRTAVEEDKIKKALEAQKSVDEPLLVVLVFRHRKILLRCIICPLCWITMTLIYYGLSINAVNMSGNQYINYIAVSAAEIPGFWIAVLLLNRIGRKPVLIGGFWICAVCQFAYVFLHSEMYVVSLVIYLVGKSSISTVVASLYLFTAEVFPTRHRHRLFAFSSMVGRVGSITAPLTPAIGAATFEGLPFVLFGGLSVLSGCLIFLAPETLGHSLPDTMEQAECLGKKTTNA